MFFFFTLLLPFSPYTYLYNDERYKFRMKTVESYIERTSKAREHLKQLTNPASEEEERGCEKSARRLMSCHNLPKGSYTRK